MEDWLDGFRDKVNEGSFNVDAGPPTPEKLTVRGVLTTLVNNYPAIVVRVKQNGKMVFMPLTDVTDQKLAKRIVMDFLKQMFAENGIG